MLQENYKFQVDVMQPLLITALRCALSARYLQECGTTNTARRAADPAFQRDETKAEVNERLEFVSSFIRRLIKKTFGAARYSYYQRPNDERTANYKFIDISPAIIDEKKAATWEILVACRYYQIPVGVVQEEATHLRGERPSWSRGSEPERIHWNRWFKLLEVNHSVRK